MQVLVLSAHGIQIGSKNITCGMMTCEMNDLEIDRVKFVFSPDVILCG